MNTDTLKILLHRRSEINEGDQTPLLRLGAPGTVQTALYQFSSTTAPKYNLLAIP